MSDAIPARVRLHFASAVGGEKKVAKTMITNVRQAACDVLCKAPTDASTNVELAVIAEVPYDELVATDVRGLLFPTVHKYSRIQGVRHETWWKVVHIWREDGQERGMWHWADRQFEKASR